MPPKLPLRSARQPRSGVRYGEGRRSGLSQTTNNSGDFGNRDDDVQSLSDAISFLAGIIKQAVRYAPHPKRAADRLRRPYDSWPTGSINAPVHREEGGALSHCSRQVRRTEVGPLKIRHMVPKTGMMLGVRVAIAGDTFMTMNASRQ